MKNINLYMTGAALLLFSAACSETEQFGTDGEGRLALATSVSGDMNVVSRASEQELADGCMVWISNDKGLVYRYEGLDNVPSSINLLSGRYVAEAWTGDSVSASFDKRWFKGREEFTITKGEVSTVSLVCKVANVAASVNYAEGLEDVLSDFTMTVGHGRGSLVFEGRDDRRGYFMMPSTDRNLAFELKGTKADGSEFVYNGVIEDAQPATEYILNVKYTAQETTVGGAVFSIVIDSKEIEVSTDVKLVPAPKISGYGFDLATPVMGEEGTIGRRSVYIASATQISNVILSGDIFSSMLPALGGNRFDLCNVTEGALADINSIGVNYKSTYDAEADQTLFQLNFEETFTNALPNGDYTIGIEATDVKGNVTAATLTIKVSDVSVVVEPVIETEIYATKATLHGTVAKDDVETAGFNYRARGASEWTYVEATPVSRAAFAKGDRFYAEVEGLDAGTTYEYCTVANGIPTAALETFTTEQAEQLPDSSFEEWFTYNGKVEIPGATYEKDKDLSYWDSGNHGSTTLGASYNLTTGSTDYAHSGLKSARLESKYVVMALAAGNIFYGRYIRTAAPNGVLGWGRPFTSRPKAMRVWVKYTPKTVDHGGNHIANGSMDQGIIYTALVDDSKQTDSKTGQSWPAIIMTNKSNESKAQLFDSNGDNVIAYGEHVFTEATSGDGMIQIEIPIEYRKEGVKPANIIVVASASRYGDFFQGAAGSVMYLDDIELVY
ncbi:MAG: DUF4493 domain-containing protein [Muribaculaceae bacterium]|nr:DUF4493 domain-containing protein [Muribaculaceae bacterium]